MQQMPSECFRTVSCGATTMTGSQKHAVLFYSRHMVNFIIRLCSTNESALPLARRDMEALDQRGATLSLEEPCSRCHARLCDPPPPDAGPSGGSLPPFYLFPTGNAFHGACLCAEAVALATVAQNSRIQYLQEALAAVRHILLSPATSALAAHSIVRMAYTPIDIFVLMSTVGIAECCSADHPGERLVCGCGGSLAALG